MSNRPVILGGKYVRSADGLHLIHEESPEVECFNRWQNGEFTKLERLASAQWRMAVSKLDLRQIADAARIAKAPLGDIRTLQEARNAATRLVDTGNQWPVLKSVVANAGFGEATLSKIRQRWTRAGNPPIRQFAPYACYVLEVDIVFELALSLSQISPDRPSNRVDMFYLYYLPFAELFVSQDRLHQRLVPLFLSGKQKFVRTDEVKRDLAVLEQRLFQLPEEERARGLMRLDGDPPKDHAGITCELWDHFRPEWRSRKPPPKLTPDQEKALLEKLKKPDRGTALPRGFGPSPNEELTSARFVRKISRQIGRWRMVSDDIK
jgi:hypothetical protein